MQFPHSMSPREGCDDGGNPSPFPLVWSGQKLWKYPISLLLAVLFSGAFPVRRTDLLIYLLGAVACLELGCGPKHQCRNMACFRELFHSEWTLYFLCVGSHLFWSLKIATVWWTWIKEYLFCCLYSTSCSLSCRDGLRGWGAGGGTSVCFSLSSDSSSVSIRVALAWNQAPVGSALSQSHVWYRITKGTSYFGKHSSGSIIYKAVCWEPYMLAYQKVLKGILHMGCASLGEAGVTPQNSQPWLSRALGLRKSLSSDNQAPIAFMWFFELAIFFLIL